MKTEGPPICIQTVSQMIALDGGRGTPTHIIHTIGWDPDTHQQLRDFG